VRNFWVALVLLCGLALAAEGLAGELEGVPNGIYTGSARGYVGPVTVKVAVKGGKIVAVRVVKHRENRALSSLGVIPRRIAQKQRTQVDAVTRATVTSKAIMKAAGEALASSSRKPAEGVPDGVYYGTAKGYVGPVKVGLRVKGGRFVAVKVVKHRENRARTSLRDIPARMVDQQKVEVDAVTGATITSRAIMRAVRQALDGARKKAKAGDEKDVKEEE